MSVTPDKPNVTQTVTITDSPTVNLRSFVSVSDTATVTDSPDIKPHLMVYVPVWKASCPITIDYTKCGSSNSTNFPFYFDSSTNATLQAQLKTSANGGLVNSSSGFDIAFYSDAALTTKLDHEIELFTGTSGLLLAWVRVPTLSSSADTVIYIAFGNDGITATQANPTGVWDSNYKLVTHLGDGSSLSAADSTGNSSAGTITGATATTGQVDGAANFAGGTDKIDFGDYANADFGTNAFTVSFWFKSSATGAYIVSKRSTCDDVNFWNVFIDGTSKLSLEVDEGGGLVNYGVARGSATIADDVWHLGVATRSGATLTVYTDGGNSGTASTGAATNLGNAASLLFGNGPCAAYTGKLDDVRISNGIARGADWILAEYNNQNAPAMFYSVGTISYYDVIIVGESITLTLSNDNLKTFSVADAITVTDAPTILIPILVPSVADSTTLSDAPTVQLLSFISVADLVTISDNPTVHLLSSINVSDTATLSDAPTVNLRSFITVSDLLTLGDSPIVHVLSFINCLETITLADAPTLNVTSSSSDDVIAADAVTLTDSPDVHLRSFIAPSDSINIDENITVAISGAGANLIINTVVDGVTVTEIVSLSLRDYPQPCVPFRSEVIPIDDPRGELMTVNASRSEIGTNTVARSNVASSNTVRPSTGVTRVSRVNIRPQDCKND